MFKRPFALAAGLVLACSAVLAQAAETLRVSAIPDEAPTELLRKFKPLGDYLEQQLGMKVQFVPVSDYPAVVEALRQLIASGAKVSYFPRDVMAATWKTSQELWKELSEKNPDFAAIYGDWKKFQHEQVSWFRVAETALDGYTFNAVQRESK